MFKHCLASAVALCFATAAQAISVTPYDAGEAAGFQTRADWETDTGTFELIDFNAPTYSTGYVGATTFDAEPGSPTISQVNGSNPQIVSSTTNPQLFPSGTQGIGYSTGNYVGLTILRIDFDTPILSLGFDLFDTELSGPRASFFVDIVDTGFNGYEITGAAYTGNLGSTFVGLISDTAFDSVQIMMGTSTDGFGFDNLSYTLAAVPVPAALPMLVAGLGGLGLIARRRTR